MGKKFQKDKVSPISRKKMLSEHFVYQIFIPLFLTALRLLFFCTIRKIISRKKKIIIVDRESLF